MPPPPLVSSSVGLFEMATSERVSSSTSAVGTSRTWWYDSRLITRRGWSQKASDSRFHAASCSEPAPAAGRLGASR